MNPLYAYRFFTGGVSGLVRPEGDKSERFSAIGPRARGSDSDEPDCER